METASTKDVVFLTAQTDIRFATTCNQSKYPWTLYNEYLRCVKTHDKDHQLCRNVAALFHSQAPTALVKTFETQREEGVWFGVQHEYEKDNDFIDLDEEEEDDDDDDDEDDE
jgi:Cytochrome oxidase c subunit VIb